jgi:hypothetical protein
MLWFVKQDIPIFSECKIWLSTYGLTTWCFSFPFSCFKYYWIFKSSCLTSLLILFWNYQNWILKFFKPDSPILLPLPNLIITRNMGMTRFDTTRAWTMFVETIRNASALTCNAVASEGEWSAIGVLGTYLCQQLTRWLMCVIPVTVGGGYSN